MLFYAFMQFGRILLHFRETRHTRVNPSDLESVVNEYSTKYRENITQCETQWKLHQVVIVGRAAQKQCIMGLQSVQLA